ncbi:indolethylamine N-methyltransferase-like isoform X2 [Phyllobates terribilis]|uniref:indolethylamine N-methyltransferase-like isoform X2 n=1 Tax=Phyllobates terribilis TaxID=111132 RepID=UPI003CCB5798
MDPPFTKQETYIMEFCPIDYFSTFYAPEKGVLFGEWTEFALKNLHETFTSGNVKGDTLIDFGAGPTIYHLLSACEVFDNIITSDFLEQNRTQLHKWLRKDRDALDWTHIVKFVCELEGNSNEWEKKEETLRRKVTKVLKCDALAEKPYDPVPMPEADCLISCLCLEAPCKDLEAFTNALKKFKELLKPGGHILIQSVLNCTFYHVGEKWFSSLSLTKDDLEKAFTEAGYGTVKIKVTPRSDRSRMDISDYDSLYFVHARKP